MAAHKRGRCDRCRKDTYRCDGCDEIGCETKECPLQLWDYKSGFFAVGKECLGCNRDFG